VPAGPVPRIRPHLPERLSSWVRVRRGPSPAVSMIRPVRRQ